RTSARTDRSGYGPPPMPQAPNGATEVHTALIRLNTARNVGSADTILLSALQAFQTLLTHIPAATAAGSSSAGQSALKPVHHNRVLCYLR
ncbi:MAG: hypothetical protein MUF23_14190, partial [Pirellula sp.]|nr:hypothetical protein [Pirellula sp.]